MGINRYTQPVNAQYVPMDINSYQRLAQAQLQAEKKPWDIIAAIKARQEQNYGNAQSAIDILDTEIAGLRAINEKDKSILKQKKDYYNGLINKAINESGGSPSAILPYLTNINRAFKMDMANGDLYNISYNYTNGMKNLEEAKKLYQKGKMNDYEYYAQQKDPLNVIPAIGNISDVSSDVLSKKFDKSILSSPEEAKANFINIMRNLYGKTYYSLDERGKAAMDNEFSSNFDNYYRGFGQSGTMGGGKAYEIVPNTGISNVNSVDNLFGGIRYDDSGKMIMEDKMQNVYDDDVLGSDYWLTPLIDAVTGTVRGKEYNEKAKNLRTIIKSGKEAYSLPEEMSDKDAAEFIQSKYQSAYNNVTNGMRLAKDTKNEFDDLSLTDKNGKIRNLSSGDMEIRKVGNSGFDKISQDKVYETLSDKLGYDNIGDLSKTLKAQDTRGVLKADGYIYYRVSNKGGDDAYEIRVRPDTETGRRIVGQSAIVNETVRNARYNKKIQMGYPVVAMKYDKKKDENVPTYSSSFEVRVVNGEPLVFYLDDDGNEITYKTTSGEIKALTARPEDISIDAFKNFAKYKVYGRE